MRPQSFSSGTVPPQKCCRTSKTYLRKSRQYAKTGAGSQHSCHIVGQVSVTPFSPGRLIFVGRLTPNSMAPRSSGGSRCCADSLNVCMATATVQSSQVRAAHALELSFRSERYYSCPSSKKHLHQELILKTKEILT